MRKYDLNTTHGSVRIYKKGVGKKKLLLIHGGGCDHAMLTWREMMERLYYDDYTAYALDLLGYGDSGRQEGASGGQFYQTHTAVVEEVCELLGLQEFALAGLSMGAAIAVRFALEHPDKVCLLLLADPWGVVQRLPHHGLCYYYVKKKTRIQKWCARMAGSRLFARCMIGGLFIGDKAKLTPKLVEEVRAVCKAPEAGKRLHECLMGSLTKKGCEPDFEMDWERLPMPVVFIQGEKDPLVAAEAVKDASFAVQNGAYYEMEGCKHWSVREQPGEFIRIMEQHMPRV